VSVIKSDETSLFGRFKLGYGGVERLYLDI